MSDKRVDNRLETTCSVNRAFRGLSMKFYPCSFAILLNLFLTPARAQLVKHDVSLGFSLNAQKLDGDIANGAFRMGGAPFNVRVSLSPITFFETEISYSRVQASRPSGNLSSHMTTFGGKAGIRFLPDRRFNPLAYLGLGIFNFRTAGQSRRYWDGYFGVGAGAEYFVGRHVGLNLMADYRFTTGDDFDGSRAGGGRDSFVNVSAGFHYHIGGRKNYAALARDQWLPGDGSLVREVNTTSDWQGGTSPFSGKTAAQAFAELTFKKNQLMRTLKAKERKIHLLQLKLDLLGRRVSELKTAISARVASRHGETSFNEILVHFQSALALYQSESYDDAIKSLQTLLITAPRHPLSASWWYWLGESYFGKGNFDVAMSAFEKAESLTLNAQTSELIHLMVGICHFRLGDRAKAIAGFQQLLASDVEANLRSVTADYLAAVVLN